MTKQQMTYEQFITMLDSQCGADFSTGGHDPYGTSCDLPRGHYPATEHEGDDPYGGDGRLTWVGGGSCVGDPLPFDRVRYFLPTPPDPTKNDG